MTAAHASGAPANTPANDDVSPQTPCVYRFEVRTLPATADPLAANAVSHAGEKLIGCDGISACKIFLIEAPLSESQANQIAQELLADPINQSVHLGTAPTPEGTRLLEVHFKPGVMDPVAQSTRDAIAEMLPHIKASDIYVATGERYDITHPTASDDDLIQFANSALGNPVIQDVTLAAHHPEKFPHGHAYEFKIAHTPLRDLDEAALIKLSREGHLFLSLDEMQCVQKYYQDAGREPTDIELETLAQTWSEHCVHKTLKANIRCDASVINDQTETPFADRPGHTLGDDNTARIDNLLKSTVAAATFKLKEDPAIGDWLVSVFDDNAGIVKFDDTHGVAIKVETHNHPSALEPYGGAATGIGGCIRDIMGTGLSAKPIASTDVFCVAHPDHFQTQATSPQSGDTDEINTKPLPDGVLHPRRVLNRIVAGVRDYGNRMGIPTINGAVVFHDDYLANPLVYCGCIGILPLDQCFGDPNPGDRIIILGGATGRDGIHGATFSSDELTNTHTDEFSHAVQIGNAITEKKTLDVILEARDYKDPETGKPRCLFTSISDCGAGGFSSAVGEMGEKVGACVTLETAPLKYRGLSYTEIWISEAQERMPLAVPAEHVAELQALCDAQDVEMCDLGYFGYEEDSKPTLKLTYEGHTVGTLAMALLHDGIPTPTREATWSPLNPRYKTKTHTPRIVTKQATASEATSSNDVAKKNASTLLSLLAHPNIASKHWIIRQYDHEVQGTSVVKPLVGPCQDGPSDAAVIRAKLDSNRGVAVGCGINPFVSEKANHDGLACDGDSYQAVLHAIDEAVRNVICVGADPEPPTGGIAILDNFCWPKCDDPWQLGTLVRAAEACYDGALAYRTPYVSGKDSLSNQFTTEEGDLLTIPQTMLITAMGMVEDVTQCVTMDAKKPGNVLLIVGTTSWQLGGSHYAQFVPLPTPNPIARVDLKAGPRNARAVASLIKQGFIQSAHDCSEGGLLVAAAEMAFAGRVGLDLDLAGQPCESCLLDQQLFAETPSRYLLEVTQNDIEKVIQSLMQSGVPFGQVGLFNEHQNLTCRTPTEGQVLTIELDELRNAWRGTLDW